MGKEDPVQCFVCDCSLNHSLNSYRFSFVLQMFYTVLVFYLLQFVYSKTDDELTMIYLNFKVTVQSERCFRSMEHISVIS